MAKPIKLFDPNGEVPDWLHDLFAEFVNERFGENAAEILEPNGIRGGSAAYFFPKTDVCLHLMPDGRVMINNDNVGNCIVYRCELCGDISPPDPADWGNPDVCDLKSSATVLLCNGCVREHCEEIIAIHSIDEVAQKLKEATTS